MVHPLLRAAVSPRMLTVTAVLATVVVATGLLGTWQLDRARANGERAAAHRVAEQRAAEPRPLLSVQAPQTAFLGNQVGVRVSVTGRWDADDQVLVSQRSKDGVDGTLILTGLRVDGADGAVLAVVRGWVAADGSSPGATPGDPAADSSGALPVGSVSVVGYLHPPESAAGAIPADGVVTSISPAGLLQQWQGPIWSGYLVLESVDPADATVALPPLPDPVTSGDNLRNLAYAIQWWIFGAFALVVWWRFLRDQLADERAATTGDVAAQAGHPTD